MDDFIYVFTMLTAPGLISVNTGGKVVTYDARAGTDRIAVPFETGTQTVSLSRNGRNVVSSTGAQSIRDTITVYNYNVFAQSATAV